MQVNIQLDSDSPSFATALRELQINKARKQHPLLKPKPETPIGMIIVHYVVLFFMISWLKIDVIACFALFRNRIWNVSIDACSWWKLRKVLNPIFSQYLYFIHVYTCATTVTITKTSQTTNCYYAGADPQPECLLKFECFRDLSVWALPSSVTNMHNIVSVLCMSCYLFLFQLCQPHQSWSNRHLHLWGLHCLLPVLLRLW